MQMCTFWHLVTCALIWQAFTALPCLHLWQSGSIDKMFKGIPGSCVCQGVPTGSAPCLFLKCSHCPAGAGLPSGYQSLVDFWPKPQSHHWGCL
ncbi:TPA: hypothetical protein ACH3X3_013786 [Trebouxia sp. C0006]